MAELASASYVILWVLVIVLSLVVLALARQVGILHERVAPAGALMPTSGPKVGELTEEMALTTLSGDELIVGGNDAQKLATFILFISPTCPVCKSLVPAARSMVRWQRQFPSSWRRARNPFASSVWLWAGNRRAMSNAFEGLLCLDKSSGPTSHDVVNEVRRLTGIRRVGHAGTLDPLATGLLLVCLGRATWLLEYLVGQPKSYVATIQLGQETSTYDAEGEIIAEGTPAAILDNDQVRSVYLGEAFTL